MAVRSHCFFSALTVALCALPVVGFVRPAPAVGRAAPGREGPPGRRGPEPPGRGRGPQDLDTMESLRVQVNATPEEWWVLLPLIQKINLARQTKNALANDHATSAASTHPTTETSADERQNANAQALRRAESDIDSGQKELRLLLTTSQQAIMTKLGYLSPP